MKIQLAFIYCYLLTMIISCNYQNRKVNFERDLPDYKNGISRDLTGLQASRDALKLDTLENGYDSIQIRFGSRMLGLILSKYLV